MPPTKKDIPKKCEICNTSDLTSFSAYIYNICISCKKIKNSKPFLCKFCGTTETDNFTKGRYSTCKKCKVNDKVIEKIYNEEKPMSIQEEIKKFILIDYTIFGGLTLKQVKENHDKEIYMLNEKNFILENENTKLKSNIFKICHELDEIKTLIENIKIKK